MRGNGEIRMMKLEAMTNDQMMAKRFEMLAFQHFNF
jgi:hypothetical protein